MAQNSFVKAFLPGLVLGVIVGGVAGAFLPPLLESASTFTGDAVQTPVERRTPTPEQVEEASRELNQQGSPVEQGDGPSPAVPAEPDAVAPAPTEPPAAPATAPST